MQDYYEDTPIPPRPARFDEKPQQKPLPRELERLLTLIRSSSALTNADFYVQAGLMADYEDTAVWKRDLVIYFPVYAKLSTAQLRGYFGWRTRWRNGQKTWAPLSFIFMHVYELLHCVGAEDADDALVRLEALEEAYAPAYPALVNYLRRWKRDMVIYYGLSSDAGQRYFADEIALDRHYSALLDNGADEQERFEAIAALSSHRMDRSLFCRERPETARVCVCRVWQALDAYYRRRWKKSAAERFAGAVVSVPVQLFQSAVFFDVHRREERSFTIDGLSSYCCRNGRWMRTAPGLSAGRRSGELGALMQETDRLMRDVFGVGKPLKAKLNKPGLSKIIRQVVEEVTREERRAARARVDLSRLEGIRAKAAQTQAMLLDGVQTEPAPPASTMTMPEVPVSPPAAAVTVSETAPADGSALTPLEHRFLQALLNGDDAAALAREAMTFPGVLADAVNDKLLERFNDIILETADDRITVIEDYENELRSYLLGTDKQERL